MKKLKSTLLLPLFVSLISCASSDPSVAQTLNQNELSLFRHPLIIGASVSGDTNALSPGKILGQRTTTPSDVRVVARGGAPGRDMITRLNDDALKGRSVIVALDFLFWDSAIRQPQEPSLKALGRLIGKAQAANIPLILGDIPELLAGAQTSRAVLNQAIRERCRPERSCYVIGLDRLYQTVQSQGYLLIEGRRFQLREILPDGLHLSAKASEYIAQMILDALRSQNASNKRT
jgi:hypothetical protein